METNERLKLRVATYLFLIKENKILLSRRVIGWQSGNYSLPSGHLDPGETLVETMIREAKEEIDISITAENIKMVHVMHRPIPGYIDFYFVASKWEGEPKNMEPEKCGDLAWFDLDKLPENMVPSVKQALLSYQKGENFYEFQIEE